MVIANRTLLERYRQSISVMLEKKRGQIDVAKLRVILLSEVDFNALKKLIFNTRLIPSL